LAADKELVHIIACDFISRKFQKRKPLPGEELDQRCQEIERSLQEIMIKLQAALAKIRIKLGVSSISQMLSTECNRTEQMASKIPVYAWVNQLKMQQFEVLDKLQRQGLQFVRKNKNLEMKEFGLCRQCPDLIIFASGLREMVERMQLVADNVLIVQDKTTSLAVHSLVKNVFDDEEVLIVNPSSVWTAIHVENLLKMRNYKSPVVKVFKKCTPDQLEEVQQALLSSGSDSE
uniref:EI2BE factor n=1 Tax=Macrostomum lignano TaxID=282301 RepID=A0A1I8HWJ9_9PLAT